MGKIVTNGAMPQCSFGMTPSTLAVSDPTRALCGNLVVATIQDMTPANIPTFGMCQSIANPQVQTATSAAMGTWTPQPCVPAITGPWAPGSAEMKVNGTPVLTNSCKCQCMWQGIISVQNPGNTAIADVK